MPVLIREDEILATCAASDEMHYQRNYQQHEEDVEEDLCYTAALPATPPNPSAAAISAITRNVKAHQA